MVNTTHAVFTGLYRLSEKSLDYKLSLLKNHGIKVYFFSWIDELAPYHGRMLRDKGVEVLQYAPPFKHPPKKGIAGRRRQLFLARKAVDHFEGNPRLLKLRWDVDFNETLLENVTQEDYLKPVDGFLNHKVWTSFYSIQEFFSTSDQSYCGHREDLDKLIQFDFKINGKPSYDYLAHDGMHLMSVLLGQNPRACDFLLSLGDPIHGLLWNKGHCESEDHLYAWAYTYHLLNKYFKTGPLGTSYYPQSDRKRWPKAIVDYDKFLENYQTIGGKSLPKYRVYDDIFVKRLVTGYYQDEFAKKLCKIIKKDFYGS